MFLGINAKGVRIEVLRRLGDELVANRTSPVGIHWQSRSWLRSINRGTCESQAWASSLDQDSYTCITKLQMVSTSKPNPPEDVAADLS